MKVNITYFGAVALSVASIIVASGIENSASLGGMLAYTFCAVLAGLASVALAGLGNYLEREEYRGHARTPEYPALPEHTEKKGA